MLPIWRMTNKGTFARALPGFAQCTFNPHVSPVLKKWEGISKKAPSSSDVAVEVGVGVRVGMIPAAVGVGESVGDMVGVGVWFGVGVLVGEGGAVVGIPVGDGKAEGV
jgi:hypothetical protein